MAIILKLRISSKRALTKIGNPVPFPVEQRAYIPFDRVAQLLGHTPRLISLCHLISTFLANELMSASLQC